MFLDHKYQSSSFNESNRDFFFSVGAEIDNFALDCGDKDNSLQHLKKSFEYISLAAFNFVISNTSKESFPDSIIERFASFILFHIASNLSIVTAV